MNSPSASPLRSIDPTTGVLIEVFELHSAADVDAILSRARKAWPGWRATGSEGRATMLRAVASRLRACRDRLAQVVVAEVGRPIVEAEQEIDRCALQCDYYATHAPGMLADERAPSDSRRSFIAHRPLGVILACVPWNLPFWQAFRTIAPVLMGGNVMVLKHAPSTYGSALLIEQVLREAGVPDGVLSVLRVDGDGAQDVIADPRVAGVLFTGSDRIGALVAANAGRHVKKTVLELGGSDAFLVLADADVAAAAAAAVRSRFMNCGQTCLAAKRFIVVDAVAEEFEERVIAAAEAIRVGDPRDRSSQMGPLARHDLRDRLESQVAATLGQGATLRTGGRRPSGPGAFFPATVMTACTPEMTAFQEETFGPVAATMRVRDADGAVAVANNCMYGLSANLWTADVDHALRLASQLETGGVFINGATHGHPGMPFGGVKRSGYGRELGAYGVREFTNLQTVWLPDE